MTKRDDQEMQVPKKPRSETTRRCGTCGGGGHNARTCKAFLDAIAPEEEDAAPPSSPAYEPPHAVLLIPNSANEDEEPPFAEEESPALPSAPAMEEEVWDLPEPSATKDAPVTMEETPVLPTAEEAPVLPTTEETQVLPVEEALVQSAPTATEETAAPPAAHAFNAETVL